MPLAKQIIARNDALKQRASSFRTLWQDCANYILPRKAQITTKTAQGEPQTTRLFDTTAEESLIVFAAGLLSHLTPQGELWARIESSEADASDELKEWFDRESQALMEEVHSSNFYGALHECFISLGAFGTGAIYLGEGERHYKLNFSEVVPGSYSIAEDNEGVVDTVFKEWRWTARQAEQQWGREALGKQVREALESRDGNQQDREFAFIHAVFPRALDEVQEGDAVEGKRRPFASIYVCVEDQAVIEESGYYEMPYAVCRLMTSMGESYGRGPGTQILPEVKLVNEIERTITRSTELVVNPPWLMPEEAAYRPDNRPGGITYWDASNPNNKPEQFRSTARIDLGEIKLEQKRERIRRAFYVDMFHMLNRPEVANKAKTATEVNAMLQEKMPSFSPIFYQVTMELLSSLLTRAFRIRVRGGRASEPPVEIIEAGGADYKITFSGRIAQEIKAAQDRGTMQVLDLAGPMAQLDPSVPYVVNWQNRFRSMARNWGLPVADLRSEEEVSEIMAAQAQAAQEAQEQELMERASVTQKNLAQAQALGGAGGQDFNP